MTKTFCDICGKEITGDSMFNKMGRIQGSNGILHFEIMTGVETESGVAWNAGHFCKSCVKEAVAKSKPTKGKSKCSGS